MPNPPRPVALTRRQYRIWRAEQEQAERNRVLYEEEDAARENAELVAQKLKWDLDKKMEANDGREFSAREIAMAATIRGMSHQDPAIAARHVSNLLKMDEINQRDVKGNEARHQHLHVHGEDGLTLLERLKAAVKDYDIQELGANGEGDPEQGAT